jgi:hypothetical protein
MGATLDSVMKSENSLAAATPLVRSAATARASTMPPPPEKPCANRHAVSTAAEDASAQSREAMAQTRVAPSSRRRRPQASDNGPSTTCPMTSPTTSAVRVSCTCAWLASNSRARSGKAGR